MHSDQIFITFSQFLGFTVGYCGDGYIRDASNCYVSGGTIAALGSFCGGVPNVERHYIKKLCACGSDPRDPNAAEQFRWDGKANSTDWMFKIIIILIIIHYPASEDQGAP